MKKIVLLFTILAVFSCKDVKKEEIQEVKINPNTFKIEVDGIWKKDDELIIFWKDASIAYFDENYTVYQGIKGSEMPQKITFELEEGFIPNDIRFDVSSNKDQKTIVLNSIKMSQQGRSFLISKDKISEYFRPNEYISLEKTSGVITTKEIDGFYDPILFTTPKIYVEMEKVLNTTF